MHIISWNDRRFDEYAKNVEASNALNASAIAELIIVDVFILKMMLLILLYIIILENQMQIKSPVWASRFQINFKCSNSNFKALIRW